MRKLFYSLAIALVALMVSLPAKAGNVYNASNFLGLYSFMRAESLTPNDTIRLTADITYSVGLSGIYNYLYIPANTTRTIDLNGHTLQHECVDKQYLFVIEMMKRSVLNICDSRGGGKIINKSLFDFVATDNKRGTLEATHTFGINSRVIDMSYAEDGVVNIYGGEILAYDNSGISATGSAIYCNSQFVGWKYFYWYDDHEFIVDQSKFTNQTVNIYGGVVSNIRNQFKTNATFENVSLDSEGDTIWTDYGHHNPETYYDYNYLLYSNEKLVVNLYGGNIGQNGMSIPALTYPQGFSGTLKDGTIYGIASEDHLNNFTGVADGVKVYLNGTQTTVNALKTQDLNDKTVRFSYEPEISVSGVEVTKDNCTDIMPWEEFKASFDYATNTLYLKTLSNPTNVLNGIQFSDFDLRIVVEGYWRIEGSIVGTNGNLTITSNHFALTEEDGDALVMKPGDNTAITLPGHRLTLTNRVRLLCYNNESGHTPQSAVKCNDMWVNNSWFDAWGKKPIVDCTYGSVVNATIKTGSFKNNDVIQVEPQFTQYYIFVQTNGDERGEVTGKGIYNEGTELTISATPKSGYYFDRWYEDGCIDATRTITVTKNATYTALFFPEEVINYYDVTVLSADETMGTVSGGGTHIEEGQTVTITATPKSGYQFLYWMDSHEQVVSGSAVLNWTVTADDVLTAHFRVAPPADAYNLWVCGTQVTGSNSADILGDGVWCYDHETRTLSTMKMATYNIENHGFIEDWVTDADPLTVVFNHLIDATCTTTDNVIRTAIVSTKGMTFTGSAYNGPSVTAKNMYVANFSDVFTVTGHITTWLYLQNTSDFGRNNFNKAILLAGKTPSLVVNGANLEVLSGVGESTGYKVSNKTDQAANLSLINAVVDGGSISAKSLYISDNSPKYEINYLTPSIESLCAVGGFNSFYEGTHITLRAYPAAGYKFVSWSDGNTDNPRYMVMPAQNVYLDPIVEVDDSQTPKGAIINASATEGQGSIADFTSGWYAEGTELTITAVAAEGYEFVQWSDGETANPYLLTVEDGKNINITAVFKDSSDTTGIDSTTDNPSPVTHKYLRNGVLYIERNGKTYNALGVELK